MSPRLTNIRAAHTERAAAAASLGDGGGRSATAEPAIEELHWRERVHSLETKCHQLKQTQQQLTAQSERMVALLREQLAAAQRDATAARAQAATYLEQANSLRSRLQQLGMAAAAQLDAAVVGPDASMKLQKAWEESLQYLLLLEQEQEPVVSPLADTVPALVWQGMRMELDIQTKGADALNSESDLRQSVEMHS
eukprot:SAG31_NODE_9437_length_1277_cov_1.800509_1_plen_194_part_10